MTHPALTIMLHMKVQLVWLLTFSNRTQDPILHITECTALSLLAMAVALAGYGLASYLHKNAQLIVPAGRILITLRWVKGHAD